MDFVVRVLAGFELASLNGVEREPMNEIASQGIGGAVS